ncbi:MAG: cytidine deaminase [Bacteroidales bacterium]|nr:cytidine deaminase [Candidatus Sodaliphilus aphodohippi]
MTELKITAKIQVYSYIELNETQKKLVDMAREATKNSYAPYSNFNVGAAILLDNGVIIKGSNQENAAFAGTCAERSAIYNAGANYPGIGIQMIAVTAFTRGSFVKEPCAPCGVCRQALLEFEKNASHPMKVLMAGEDTVYEAESITDLLPLCFKEF